MKKQTQSPTKLSFQKQSFRVLDPRELSRIQGGNGEMVLDGQPEMILSGELVPAAGEK